MPLSPLSRKQLKVVELSCMLPFITLSQSGFLTRLNRSWSLTTLNKLWFLTKNTNTRMASSQSSISGSN